MSIVVQFTRNGRPTGGSQSPPIGPNDVHFKFERSDPKASAKFQFTKGGKPVGDPHEAPKNAKDVGVEFHEGENCRVTMRDAHWTDGEGNVIGGIGGYIAPPEGADDWHFEIKGGVITEARWTRDGWEPERGGYLNVPRDANDVHVSPLRRGTYAPSPYPAPDGEHAADRQLQLSRDLEAVGQRFDVLSNVLDSAKGVLDEHEFNEFGRRLEQVHDRESQATGGKPPDDLYEELKALAEKLSRLQHKGSYERKLPWRHQIRIDILISILVEILHILWKLYRRSLPRGTPT